MIGLQDATTGQFLKLYPDTRISLTLVNPIFADDNVIPGSFSLPFEVPVGDDSPENDEALQYPRLVHRPTNQKEFSYWLWLDGVRWKKGVLTIGDWSGNRLETHFKFGLGSLGDEFKASKIRDLVDEQVVMDNTAITKIVYLKPSATATLPYKIRINDIEYEGGSLTALRDAINAQPDVTKRAVATIITSGNTPLGVTPNYLELRPQLNADDPLTPFSVQPIEDTDVERNKWITESFNVTPYYNGIANFLNPFFGIGSPNAYDAKIKFPYVVNLGLYQDSFTNNPTTTSDFNKRHPSINARSAAGLIFNNPNTGFFRPVLNLNSYCPFVPLLHVLQCIGTEFGFAYEGDLYNNADFQTLLFYHTEALDVSQPFIGYKPFIFIKRSFNLRDLVPDYKSVDLLKDLQKLFCAAVYYNERTGKLRIQLRKPMVQSYEHIDITEHVSNQKGGSNTTLTGLRLQQKLDEKDSFAKALNADFYEVGVPEETISTELSGLVFDANYNVSATEQLTGPVVAQKLSSEYTPRLFFYKGIAGTPYTHPRASFEASTYRLSWNGDGTQAKGLWANFHKEWVRFLINRKLVKHNVNWPLRILKDIDWERKYRIDRMDHFIKKIEVTITMNGIEPESPAEFYTVGVGALPA